MKPVVDIAKTISALEELMGVPVDAVTPGDLPFKIRQQIVNEARPL